MGWLDVQKTGMVTDETLKALSVNESVKNTDINITLNKNQEIPKPDEATEKKIKTMVALLYPNVEWNSLSDIEKQSYIVQYYDGSLEQKCKDLEPKIEEFKANLKNMTPEEAAQTIIRTTMERKDPNFKNLSKAEQEKRIQEEGLKLLKAFTPELDIENMSDKEKEVQLKTYEFKLQTACYAYQTGKIDKLEDFKNYTPAQIQDLEYEFAKNAVEANKELESNHLMKYAIAMGDLDRAIAEKNQISLDELRNSEDKYNLMLKYLEEKPESELTEYEKYQLGTLKKLAFIYNSDLKGMNLTNEGSITDSYLNKISGGKPTNWHDSAQFQILCDKLHADLKECKTPEEKQAKIAEIVGSCRGNVADAEVLFNALAILEKTGAVGAEDLYAGAKQAHISSHGLVACSAQFSEDGQRYTADHIAENCHGEHPEFSHEQVAGYTKNMTPQYAKSTQAYTANKMTDTGIQKVLDELPETYGKLDTEAAKESYEYAMNSDKLTDEQKAIIARDTIDRTGDSELKKSYEDLASKYKVDYSSVPPKAERVQTAPNKQTNNDTSNNKVQGTNFTEKEIAELLNQTQNKDVVSIVINGVIETVDIILGKTPDNNLITNAQPITSLNTAISQLKSGTKLNDVFRQSNNETKKELVEIICAYGKTAIAQLIDAFGGQTIYRLAKTDAAKELIEKELERIALNNSTQRAELAEIKKTKEKDGLNLTS